MPATRISLACDCGRSEYVGYGERWRCDGCGRSYDTSGIPAADMAAIDAVRRRYRAVAVGPPAVAAAVLVPLAAVAGLQWGLLLFLLVLAHGLLVLPRLRTRGRERLEALSKRWQLEAE